MTGTAELHRLALAHVVRQRARVEREAERELAALREAVEAAEIGVVLAELRDAGAGPEPKGEAT